MNTDIRSTLRTEIELTRHKFHRLLVTIPEETLKLPSRDPAWTNGEVLYRMSVASLIIVSILKSNAAENSSLSFVSQIVTGSQIQRNNELFIRLRAAQSTLWFIVWEYDETYKLVLKILDNIAGDTFNQTLLISGSDPLLPGPVTTEQLFHYAKNNFDTYSQQLNLVQ